jgi:hypothetical protein
MLHAVLCYIAIAASVAFLGYHFVKFIGFGIDAVLDMVF